MKLKHVLIFTACAIFALVLIAPDDPEEPPAPDALDMMHTVFVGSYSRIQIKNRLDLVLDLYHTPKTEENYNRAGSVLVSLRKKSEIPEMDILDCMKRSALILADKEFHEAAAYCVTAMY